MKSRLKDIAEESGVSVNTVSLALRGSSRVAEETRRRISEVARRNNYIPNSIARSLVQQRTQTVGLLLTDILNPILTATAQLAERLLADKGFAVLLATSTHSSEVERASLDVLRARQVDGFLVFPVAQDRVGHLEALQNAGHPVVLLAGTEVSTLNVVSVDNEAGAYLATAHLLKLGHQRVALVDGAARSGNSAKRQGYRRALHETKVGFDSALVVTPSGFSYDDGYSVAHQLFDSPCPPTAVFATTDALAVGIMRWCRDNNIRVPRDVAVVGFDNTDVARFTEPTLTSVAYDTPSLSKQAVDCLLRLIDRGRTKRDPLPPERTVITPKLTVRESCGAT